MPLMTRTAGLGALLLVLASCGIPGGRAPANHPVAPEDVQTGHAATDDLVKIGNPYQVNGITYTPSDAPKYDEVGYASWYAEESGNVTANGEASSRSNCGRGHRTLPLAQLC